LGTLGAACRVGVAAAEQGAERVHIEITTRHGSLEPDQQAYLNDKAQKLLRYFGRLMAIEVEVDHRKNDCLVEIFVSAEHKHDIVARESGATPEAAMDLCVHKVEQQLRRYKERIQHHKGDIPQGGSGPDGLFTANPAERAAPSAPGEGGA
jgi:putative sigma-54 modulation protein